MFSRRSVLLLAVAVLAVSGCSSRPPIDEMRIENPVLWSASTQSTDSVMGAEIRGDAAVLAATSSSGDDRLVVIDTKTGEERWHASAGQSLSIGEGVHLEGGNDTWSPVPLFVSHLGRPVVSDGKSWVVALPYQREDGDEVEIGIVGLSGKDGTPLWKLKVGSEPKPADESESRAVALPMVAGSGVVVAASRGEDGGDQGNVIAIDAKTGKQLWRDSLNGQPVAIDGDSLLGVGGSDFDDIFSKVTYTEGAMAWKLRSGKELWSSDDMGDYEWRAAANGVVMLSGRADDYRDYYVAVNAATGEEITEVAEDNSSETGCVTDAELIIACETGDGLATLYLDDHSVTTADDPEFVAEDEQLRLTAAYAGQILAADSEGAEWNASARLIDPDANVLAKQAPERVLAAAESSIVYTKRIISDTEGVTTTTELHRIRS
ncbi:MAG: PQQ-binding-like beta-propeller repeat protein [Stackebrandtia sp.]